MIDTSDLGRIVEEAQERGMHVVSEESSSLLFVEYENKVLEAGRLGAIEDEVSEPFKSKYAARALLDELVNKMEATRTIAAVEGKKARIAELDWRIASVRVRLGGISWECEEPHNAQTDLELAAEFFAPSYTTAVAKTVVECGEDCEDDNDDVSAAGQDLAVGKGNFADRFVAPEITSSYVLVTHKVEAMKCFNLLGILWAGRGQVRKSFMYLLAAKRLYGSSGEDEKEDVTAVYTHTLFYLAQAYGKIGDTARSSHYCYETLQRQLSGGFESQRRIALDWVKNCASISDFYKSMKQYRRCALALASAESIMKAQVTEISDTTKAEDKDEFSQICDHVTADIHSRWAALELIVLKRAFDRKSKSFNFGDGDALEPEETEETAGDDDDFGAAAAATAAAKAIQTVFVPPHESTRMSADPQDWLKVDFFSSLPVSSVPYICVGDVTTFETARAVFLRGSSRLEAAKKYYQLDGHVTDHVNLLHDHSRMYHYLSVFETDIKRKMAMENRRVDMLRPLITQLNKAAFEVLHKQVSFEVGEAYMSLLEIKVEKLVNDCLASSKIQGRRAMLDERTMKRGDMVKCNNYACGALAMFTHYLSFFARSSDHNARGGSKPFTEMTFLELANVDFPEPDDTLITDEEMRSFLNAHFFCCRVLSKIVNPPDAAPRERTFPLVTCLRRYEWLSKTGPAICSRKGINLDDVFFKERQIIDEMIMLLPSKIDRIHFNGESAML